MDAVRAVKSREDPHRSMRPCRARMLCESWLVAGWWPGCPAWSGWSVCGHRGVKQQSETRTRAGNSSRKNGRPHNAELLFVAL